MDKICIGEIEVQNWEKIYSTVRNFSFSFFLFYIYIHFTKNCTTF